MNLLGDAGFFSNRKCTNGDYFEGEWEAGLRQGDGVLVYANGNVYEGQWEADKKEGKGRFSHASGVIQVFP